MYEKFDSVKGEVTYNSSKGVYIKINDNYSGFIPRLFLKTGTQVFATVKAVKEDGFPILSLDSVVYDAA